MWDAIYSARRLMGSWIIESATYCNQILLAPLYLNSTQNMSVNWIIRLSLSLFCWPKVILLSGKHCSTSNNNRKVIQQLLFTILRLKKYLPLKNCFSNQITDRKHPKGYCQQIEISLLHYTMFILSKNLYQKFFQLLL